MTQWLLSEICEPRLFRAGEPLQNKGLIWTWRKKGVFVELKPVLAGGSPAYEFGFCPYLEGERSG
jgi:hypothetical protein